MRSTLFGSLLLATFALAACHDDAPPPATPDMAATPPPPPPPAPPTADPAPPPPPVADTKPAAAKLSDGDIAAVETAANNGEIAMANLATKSSKNAQVKSFASMMVKEHGEAEAKAKKIAQTAKISPTDNDVSTKVKSDGDSTLASLKGQKGADFDKAYMDAQVKVHQDVLTTIDEKLLPNVQNAELKTHLTDVRGHVVHHLEKAKEISGALGTAKP